MRSRFCTVSAFLRIQTGLPATGAPRHCNSVSAKKQAPPVFLHAEGVNDTIGRNGKRQKQFTEIGCVTIKPKAKIDMER